MYGQAEGFIAPCFWGLKEKESSYVLFNEGSEDVMLNSHHVSNEMVKRGGRFRIFGNITNQRGFKEMSVERFIELE